MPGSLGIFSFSVLGVLKQGAMVVAVNSTATTLVGVRPSDDNVMLGCREATQFKAEQAVLRVSGTIYYMYKHTNLKALDIVWTQ